MFHNYLCYQFLKSSVDLLSFYAEDKSIVSWKFSYW